MTGDELFSVVEAYSDLGDHRTGTTVDAATVDWFVAELTALDATVARLPYEFPRYAVDWDVRVDGESVPSMPLFYEGVGEVRSAAPFTAAVDVVGGARLPDWGDKVRAARAADAEVAVVATNTPTGLLCAVNREPEMGSGLLTVCVPGAAADVFGDATVEVVMAAEVVTGESANVLAKVGDGPDADRVLLTTPLSGWFRCAGERGTGIAVLLAVARTLAAEGVPLTILGTNGHELQGLGLRRWLDTNRPAEKAVFHFGASVASGDADGKEPPVARTNMVRVSAWAGEVRREALRSALAPLGVDVRLPSDEEATNPRGWIGESVVWAPLGRALVSIAGGFPLHHAPEDLPRLATTPSLLRQSYEAALAATRVLATV